MRALLTRIAAWAVERPAPVMALAILLSLVAAVGALSLEADRDPSSLVDRDSEAFGATENFYDRFGDEPVRILVEGDLRKLVLDSKNLNTMLGLEACLAGSAPGGQIFGENQPAPSVCARLAEDKPAQVVFGPATFLNQTAKTAQDVLQQQTQAMLQQAQEAGRQAAIAARKAGKSTAEQLADARAAADEVQTAFQQRLFQAATQYGLNGLPSISDPTYVSQVVFDQRIGGGTPKARFNFLFPSREAAMITIRLRPDLTQPERERAIDLFRAAVDDPTFRLDGGAYVVSGVPVIFDGLAQELQSQIFILLAVALALMAITLALVFGPPLRLLPLALALGASAIAFGLLAIFGGSLTMASIAVLPVLTGLAVDYAIQFHARFVEALREGASAPRAALEAAGNGGPVIATAMLATVAGFAVLLLSPIPMVRGFGLMLVVGMLVAFGLALTAGLATLSMTGTTSARTRRTSLHQRHSVGPGTFGERLRGNAAVARASGVLAAGRARVGRVGQAALGATIRAPGRVLAAAVVLAVAGWIAGTKTELISDIRQLLPNDLPELQDVDELERVTGQSGDVYVTVAADDLTDPAVIDWMNTYQQRVLDRHGFSSQQTSCQEGDSEVCPGPTLATLFSGQQAPTQAQVRQALDILPDYFAKAVVDRDDTGDGGTALIGFGIRVMPFDQQKELIDDMRDQIDPADGPGPPPGVEAQVVGLPVLAADANAALEANRYVLTVAGLAVVALALFGTYALGARGGGEPARRAIAYGLRRAVVVLVPIVLATGWSSLVLEAADVPLNPMSATLGALVIAIGTEFSVILAARYEAERAGGRSVGEALRRTYARTGAAVAASGTTAIAGFAVLIVSDVRMLRDFGLVTVFDLVVALVGVMLVLPATLVWAEGGLEPLLARLRSRPAPSETQA
jgi:hydrophobe/amphiphile efflux-3 (HAE3) family protein